MPCSSGRRRRSSEPADEPPAAPLPHGEDRLVDRIAEEYLDRLIAGEVPDRSEILRAHPEVAVDLDRRLALMELLFRARPGG